MSFGKSAALASVGCAAVCVGISAGPALLVGSAAGFGGALVTGETGLALAVLLGALALWVGLVILDRNRARPAACACPPGAGCQAGNACDLPVAPPP